MTAQAWGILAAVGTSMGWGLSGVCIAKGQQRLPVMMGTTLSLLASLASLLVVLVWHSALPSLWQIPTAGWLWFGLAGLLNFPVARFLNYRAIARMGAARGVAVRSFAPAATVLVSTAITHQVPGISLIIGIVCIAVGLSRMGNPAESHGPRLSLWVWAGGVFSAVAFGVVPIVVHHAEGLSPDTLPVMGATIAMAAGSLALAGMSVGQFQRVRAGGVAVLWFILAGVLAGMGQYAYWNALTWQTPGVVAAISALAPMWTVIGGSVFHGADRLNRRFLEGLAVVLAGGVMVALYAI